MIIFKRLVFVVPAVPKAKRDHLSLSSSRPARVTEPDPVSELISAGNVVQW